MEALGLTPEQLEIVTARGRDVLVTAGAGSGKTRVLVERYLALLDECAVPQIAAVTFTDAAATEMRQRVRRAVMERDALAAHRASLDDAVIGTVHALCRQLLRQFPFESGIDPAAPVLADDEAEFELQVACLDALESAAAEPDGDRLRAVRAIGPYFLGIVLPDLVARRDEVREAFAALPGTPDEREVHVRALLDAASAEAVEAERATVVDALDAVIADRIAGGSDPLTRVLDDLVAALGPAPRSLPAQEFAGRLLGVRISLTGGQRANWAVEAAEVRARLRLIRGAQERIEKAPRWNDHDAASLEVVDGLQLLFEDACARYEERKRSLGALDYLDLELHAARLLATHAEVARRCRETFRHVMVDEVQDTSPLQMRVLRLLAGRDLTTGAPVGDGPHPLLFLVGDAKQAIYRFRGSDVREFNRAHAAIEAAGGAVLRLSRSFRTHDPLVEALNDLFDVVLGAGGLDYEAPMQRMTGRGDAGPPAPHLTLLPIAATKPDGTRALDEEARRVEADLVAAEIERLLASTDRVWDNDARAYRRPTYRDVAVLLRRLKNVHLFELALESHGLPYRTPAGAGFFTRQEVLDCTNLLAWLAEPDDAIALLGVLRSPFFLLDDLTLLHLAQVPANEPGAWLRALAAPPAPIAGEARARCLHACEVLTALREEAAHASVDALLESALARTAVEAAWAPLQGGDQALANIRKFVAMARTLAGRSLDEFVAYVTRRRDDLAAREGQAVLDDSDAVRLLTVHGAKGLDFPIVFVPEAHVRSREDYEAVRVRREDGVAFTFAPDPDADDTTRPRPGLYALLHARDEAEDRAEHRRLLYVAATRAADRLVISGGESGGWMQAAREAFDTLPAHRREAIEVRAPALVDLDAVTRRPAPRQVTVPDAAAEVEFDPPLVARPAVIPLRASTPVTALRPRPEQTTTSAHGDGLALLRGALAHRAIELTYTTGARPDLLALLERIDEGALDAAARAHVTAEVAAMLDRFDVSPLALTLRDPATESWFEFPFAWDWDGVPVHGTLDLLVRTADGAYHVVDFKTDDLRVRGARAVAADYLAQLGLYAGALERATGARPTAAFCFLRTGELYAPPPEDLAAALARTRAEVDAGRLRALDPDAAEIAEAAPGFE